jgi:hypothetical protein
MSAIDEKIKKLREEEKQLELEKRKVEFLRHILESAEKYEHKSFADVKADVMLRLRKFVELSIQEIETGGPVTITAGAPAPTAFAQEKPPAPAAPKGPAEPSPAEKLNFALDNRHLGGKMVNVLNDKNVEIKGQVIGLDAPFVIVKTDTGPTIKVPLPNVSLQ